MVTYFPFQGGRGAAVEIALLAAGIPYQFVGIPFADYQTKKSTTDDHAWKNGLPVITIDGKTFSQSLAILRYAGKKGNLYPKDDVAALLCDEVMDIAQDILTKCPQDPDEEVKKAKRIEYARGKMAALFELLNQRAAEAASGFLVGPDLTIGDLVNYFTLKMIRDGMFDHVETTYTDKWPALVAFEAAVADHEVLKAYAASKA